MITRTSVIITMVLGFLFLTCNFEASNVWSILILGTLTTIFGFISYKRLKNMSEQEIKDTFCLTWLEKKIGINFTEE